MQLKPFGNVGSDIITSISPPRESFVHGRIIKTSRVKEEGIHWKLLEPEGRLGHSRLDRKAGARGLPV